MPRESNLVAFGSSRQPFTPLPHIPHNLPVRRPGFITQIDFLNLESGGSLLVVHGPFQRRGRIIF